MRKAVFASMMMATAMTGLPLAAADEVALSMPEGFRAEVVAVDLGLVRHLTVGKGGWIYAALARSKDGKGAVALRDSDDDGKADDIRYFASGLRGTGMKINDGYLYMGTRTTIVRWPLAAGVVPEGEPQVMVSGFPVQRAHAAKSMAFDGKGHVYVNVGAPSNACMEETRQKGSPGQQPCAELEQQGGIWRFDASKPGQDQMRDGFRYATGLRNAVAVRWNTSADALYLTQHGRDQLNQFFPELFDKTASAELPAEELHRVEEGDNLGWPYSYYDQRIGSRMLMPEYGGDGKIRASDTGFKVPVAAFPGHWAPNDLIFPGSAFWPEAYQGGALIAFHGSWNRGNAQQGYKLVYVPMDKNGAVDGKWATFMDGFAGPGPIKSAGDAKYRPGGLAEGPDGALYISSAQGGGRVWRVTYEGN